MGLREEILEQNAQVKTMHDLITLVQRIVNVIATGRGAELSLEPVGLRCSPRLLRYAPSYAKGKGAGPGTYAFTALQIAKLLGRTQKTHKAGGMRPDFDLQIAIKFLEAHETGTVLTTNLNRVIDEMTEDAQLQIARSI